MRLVFFDLETGGLDPQKHPIIQIAAIAVDEQLRELDTFEAKILFRPENADPEALKLNSYNAEEWAAKGRNPIEVCDDLSGFLRVFSDVDMVSAKSGKPYKVAQLIGHNSDSFDGPFLQAWYKRLNQFMPAAFRTLCTYQRALHHFHENPHIGKPASFKLTDLCKFYGIELSGAHDALADCRATVELYRALRRDAAALASPEAVGASN